MRVETLESNVVIEAGNIEQAFNVVRELNSRHDLKRTDRGISGCELRKATARRNENFKKIGLPIPAVKSEEGHYGNPQVAFSELEWNYDEIHNSLQSVLTQLGFDVTEDENGDLRLNFLRLERKGEEDVFLEALAPFVKEGSHMTWVNAKNDRWKWTFDGQHMTVIPLVAKYVESSEGEHKADKL